MQDIQQKLDSAFGKKNDLDSRLKSGSSSVLTQKLEFEDARHPHSSVADMLKGKYVNLIVGTAAPQKKVQNSASHSGDDGEGLPHSKEVLFSEDKLDFSWRFARGAGFQNNGNTCFLNATLQCLVHCPPLANYLMSGEHQSSCRVANKDRCILCNLQFITKRSLSGVADCLSPKWFTNNLQYIGRHFRIGRQEDAHEFLRLSLEKMMKCAHFGHSHLDKYSKDTTVIHQIYAGYLRSQVVCSRCGYKSNTYDPLLDVSLDIKNVETLERAFQLFVAADKLELENAYKCDKCKQKVTATKRFTIHKAPNVLTIQLKRFQFAASSFFMGGGGKINKQIRYPHKLNIRPYMSNITGSPVIYSLFATIQHEGYSSQSGHYVANVRCGQQWVHYNDSMRRLTTLQRCLDEPSAYILFYIKDNVHGSSQNAQQPSKMVCTQPSPKPVHVSASTTSPRPIGPELIKTPDRPVFKPTTGPSNDIGKPVKSPLTPLSVNREKIRINFGVKTLNKTPEMNKPTGPKPDASASLAETGLSTSKQESPPTPRLVMKIQGGKSCTIETSPAGERRIISDDDEVVTKMNETRQRKYRKRSSLVPYGDDSSDSDWSNRGSSPTLSDGSKKRRIEAGSKGQCSLPGENASVHPLHEHNYGSKESSQVLFDQSLNTTTSVPGNAHLMETLTLKDRLSHTNPERHSDVKHAGAKSGLSTPTKKNLHVAISCDITPTTAKHAGPKEWTTVVESVKSPVGSNHSNCSVHSNHSTSEWSVSKSVPVKQMHSHKGWTVTPSKGLTNSSTSVTSAKHVGDSVKEPDNPSYSSPYLVDNDKDRLLNSGHKKDSDDEYRSHKKHKKHKKHRYHDREETEGKYTELDDSSSHAHKKKKNKHKDRDDERNKYEKHSSRDASKDRKCSSDNDSQTSQEKTSDRSHSDDLTRQGNLGKTHKRSYPDERPAKAGGKRMRRESDESPEYEWVEKPIVTPHRGSRSAPASPPRQSWDHHVKDGYKRPSLSGSSTPLKTSWDGLKTSKVVHELQNFAAYGYGAPVSGWDGGQSGLDQELYKQRSSHTQRDSDDNYNDEYDKGKVKKVKNKNHEDHRHNDNLFQKEQDCRNKSKLNWSSMKIGDNNPFGKLSVGIHNSHHRF